MSSTTGKGRLPKDAYYTPAPLAEALVGLLPIAKADTVWEPHAGGGAFADALVKRAGIVIASDIDPEAPSVARPAEVGYHAHVGDFLVPGVVPRIDGPEGWSGYWKVDWVVGNPPFTGFEAHVDRALAVAPNVAFLLRLAAMETQGRIACWRRWPLRRVWVLARRPSFTGGGTDSCAYGFFLFDTAFKGEPTIVPGWSWK